MYAHNSNITVSNEALQLPSGELFAHSTRFGARFPGLCKYRFCVTINCSRFRCSFIVYHTQRRLGKSKSSKSMKTGKSMKMSKSKAPKTSKSKSRTKKTKAKSKSAPAPVPTPPTIPTPVPSAPVAPVAPVSPSSGFDITLQLVGAPTAAEPFFNSAKTRWETIITGDLPDVSTDGFDSIGGLCLLPDLIDDLYICAGYDVLDPSDGVGGTLAAAGPLLFRVDEFGNPTGLPAVGIMTFDSADASNDAQFAQTVLHEMGHVLGR